MRMVKLCGLWVRRNKASGAAEALSGSIGNLRVMAFRNHTKAGPLDPDLNLFIVEPEKHEHVDPPTKFRAMFDCLEGSH